MNPGAGRVVVGYDGSPWSELALRWASDQAWATGRPLTVVHVGRAKELAALGQATAQARFPRLHVDAVRMTGDPRTALLELAAADGLLVVGTRGHGRVASLLLGSVSSAVVRHAVGPLAVVRQPRPGAGVLVATDEAGDVTAAVAAAYDEATWRHEPVTVVHCTWDGALAHVGWDDVHSPGRAQDQVELLMADLRTSWPEVVGRARIVRGDPVACLSDLSRRHDLVVVGRAPDGGPGMAPAVAEHAHATTLVVM